MITKLLSTSAHNSPQTSHVIKDWPYGRKLRCEKHLWIETRKGFGQRVVYRTTNPKRGDAFNAPKAGGYSMLTIFGEDENGLLVHDGLTYGSRPADFARVGALPLDENQRERFDKIKHLSCISNPTMWKMWEDEQQKGFESNQ